MFKHKHTLYDSWIEGLLFYRFMVSLSEVKWCVYYTFPYLSFTIQTTYNKIEIRKIVLCTGDDFCYIGVT